MKTFDHPCRSADGRQRGMTLVELLVVIAIIAILASLLLPVLGNAKAQSQQTACIGNLRQLNVAFQLYASDNRNYLAENSSPARVLKNTWVFGSVKTPEDATNNGLIKTGELYAYAGQVGIYHCPVDNTTSGGVPRNRSYSMNSWIGTPLMEAEEAKTPYRVFIKDSDLAAGHPSATFTFIDEHVLTLDDGLFMVTMDNSKPFTSLPATRHQNGYGISFADGHADAYRVRTIAAQIAESQSQAFSGQGAPAFSPSNQDWVKLTSVTTSR